MQPPSAALLITEITAILPDGNTKNRLPHERTPLC